MLSQGRDAGEKWHDLLFMPLEGQDLSHDWLS
jgi:hypothetical protein